MRSEPKWAGLPSELLTHELSVHSFRGLSGCVCIKFESQVAVFNTYPFKPYLMLSTSSPGIAESTADSVIFDLLYRPCIMDAYWHRHASMYPSRALLLSLDSLARAELLASEVEFDCISVETNNANMYRSIKRCVQQRLAALPDISASWETRNDRLCHVDVFGSQELSPDKVMAEGDEKDKSRKKMGGGGGTCRAFVSCMAKLPSMRKANGSVDFSRIMAAWKVEN